MVNGGAVKAQASQMLPIMRHELQAETDMGPKELRERLNGILEAIAAGRTCEQILLADRTLTYRDIFHAVAEAPTSYWEKASAVNKSKGPRRQANSIQRPVRQRSD